MKDITFFFLTLICTESTGKMKIITHNLHNYNVSFNISGPGTYKISLFTRYNIQTFPVSRFQGRTLPGYVRLTSLAPAATG